MDTRKFASRLPRAIAAAMLGAACAGGASAAEMPESSDPIRLAVNSWTGAEITTRIAGNVLEEAGYNVEYVNAGYFPQFKAITQGDLHATLEVWSNNGVEQFRDALDSGDAVSLGNLGVEANEGWAYPAYVEEECPGLPDWQALRECIETFRTADTYPNGRILAYPADWGGRSEKMIEGFDLDYEAVSGGSEGAMIAELRSAVQREEPLIMMFWYPHWIFNEVDLRWVEMPEWEDACAEDPSWGPNPDATHDCRVEAPRLFKMAWVGFEDKWPGAHEILEQYQFNAEDQIRMIYAVDVEEEDLEEVVGAWLADNEKAWKGWIEQARR